MSVDQTQHLDTQKRLDMDGQALSRAQVPPEMLPALQRVAGYNACSIETVRRLMAQQPVTQQQLHEALLDAVTGGHAEIVR